MCTSISLQGPVLILRYFTSTIDSLHRNNNNEAYIYYNQLRSLMLYFLRRYYCSPALLAQIYCASRLVSLPCLFLSWCLHMVINIRVQYNGGLLSDTILLTLCDYGTLGNPFNTMKSLCPYSQCSRLNLLAFPCGYSEGLDAFRCFVELWKTLGRRN